MLDNAPTYVTFLETELGKLDPDEVAFVRAVIKTPGKERPTPGDVAAFADKFPERFKDAPAREAFAAI